MGLLDRIKKPGSSTPSMTFPLQVESYFTGEGLHHVSGINLATGEAVKVFLRSWENRDSDRTRPEIIHFATDTLGEARRSKSQARIVAAENDPLAKVHTKPDGVLLVEGAYLDKKVDGMLSASWLRVLSHNASETLVETNVDVCVNEPYSRAGERPSASVDVLYPQRKVAAANTDELEAFLQDILSVSTKGKGICSVRFIDVESGDIAATLVTPRNVGDALRGFEQEPTTATVERFWSGLGDEDYISQIRASIDSGTIKTEVIPGVRYYFVGKVLESLTTGKNKLPAKFKLPADELENGQRTHGFVKSTIGLRPYENSTDYFPIGVYPLQTYDAPVTPLQNLQ